MENCVQFTTLANRLRPVFFLLRPNEVSVCLKSDTIFRRRNTIHYKPEERVRPRGRDTRSLKKIFMRVIPIKGRKATVPPGSRAASAREAEDLKSTLLIHSL